MEPLIPSNETRQEYLLRDGAFYRRNISTEFLGFQDQILNSLVESPPQLVTNLSVWNQKPVGALFGGNADNPWSVLFTQLPSLPICINMHLSKDGTKLAPKDNTDFLPNQVVKGAVTIRDPWTPPAFARIFFFVKFVATSYGQCPETCYLFLKTDTGQFLVPFYPNIHDNGRVCMGPDYVRETSALQAKRMPLMDYFIKAHTSFHTSAGNADLVRSGHLALLRRKVDAEGNHTWDNPTEENAANNAKLGLPGSTAWMAHLRNI